MNQHNIYLLDLPNEILFLILKKLDNKRLEIIAQEQIFTNILNFVSISQSTNEISISGSMLDQFCISILPRIHKNVKSLILESVSMECILRASNYPNLTELKIFNFNKAICSRYFMGKIFMYTGLLKDQHTKILRCSHLIISIYFV